MSMLALILSLTSLSIVKAITYQQSQFVNYQSGGWQDDNLECIDSIDCTVNCYGYDACYGATIIGPENAVLTINCHSKHNATNQDDWACYYMNVYAENSTQLYINVYNSDYEFVSNNIYTPASNESITNTFITCGMIGTHNDNLGKSYSCGYNNNIYSINGWKTVEWTYAGNALWSLTEDPSYPNQMHCSTNYLSSCAGFVDTFFYRCTNTASVCDYSRTNQTLSTTPNPTTTTATPTAPSISPTQIPSGSPSQPPTIAPSLASSIYGMAVNTIIIAMAVVTVAIVAVICLFMYFRKRKQAKILSNVDKDGIMEMNSRYKERKNSNKEQKRNENEMMQLGTNKIKKNIKKTSPKHTTLGSLPKRIDLNPSAPAINKQTGRTDGNDENVEYKSHKPSAPDIDNEDKPKLCGKYYVGQRLMIKISKVAKASATVIFAQNMSKWIVVKYDLYSCDDGKNTETLHIIDDDHRIEIRGNNKDEESIKDEMDIKDKMIENDMDDDKDDNNNDDEQTEVERSQTKSMEKECVICMDKNKNHICVPCGHECVCQDCKDLIDKCPICRSIITTTIRVYR